MVATGNIDFNRGFKDFAEKSHNSLKGVSGHRRCVILDGEKLVGKWSFISILPSIFFKVFGNTRPFQNYISENKRALQHFKDVFGEHRVEQLLERTEITFDEKRGLSKRDVQELFLALADVKSGDLEAAFKEIKSKERGKYLEKISDADFEVLQLRFKGKTEISKLSGPDIHYLISVLKPFDRLSDVTMDKNVKTKITSVHSGMGFQGRRNNLMLVELAAKEGAREPDLWNYIIGKGLAAGQPVEGMIIPHLSGCYRVAATVSGDGAYKVFLKCMNKEDPEQGFVDTILYRCTSPFPTAKEGAASVYNDMQASIGAAGHKHTKDDTAAMLTGTDPEHKFARPENSEGPHRINMLGFSLGGGHLQRDLVDILTDENLRDRFEVRDVNVLSGIGLGADSIDKFDEFIKKKGWPEHLKIDYRLSAGDVVPLVGDGSLGGSEGVYDPTHVKVFLHTKGNVDSNVRAVEDLLKDFDPQRFPGMALKAIIGFLGAHREAWYEEGFREIELGTEISKAYLRREKALEKWEKLRSKGGLITNIIDKLFRREISNPIIESLA